MKNNILSYKIQQLKNLTRDTNLDHITHSSDGKKAYSASQLCVLSTGLFPVVESQGLTPAHL